MSDRHVELARRAYAAFGRGDIPGALRYMHPEIEWRTSEQFARGGRVFRGHEGVRHLLELFDEALADFRTEPLRFIDADDAVVVPVRITGHTRGGGEQVEIELVQVWRVADDLATRLDVYATFAEACSAVGIGVPEESSASA